ncbi:MAG: hypothetical protein ACM3OC_09405 [Deltaproteobacteria bacterium]
MAAFGLQHRFGGVEKAVKLSVTVLLALCLCVPGPCRAQQQSDTGKKGAFGEAAVGGALKILAKTYVNTTNIKKLAKRHIKRIEKMDEETFQAYYGRTLSVIKASPRLTTDFGVPAYLTREAALDQLRQVNKEKLCRMIDAVPDKVVIEQFKSFSSRHSEELTGKDAVGKAQIGWKTFQERLEK